MVAPASAEQHLRFGEFELEPANGRLLRGGRRVEIEPKAFDLLVVLARGRGRLVDKEEILEAVWNGAFVTDNALTRTVARLRKALGDSAREPRFVETVHTRGYRFLAEVEVVDGPAGAAGSWRPARRYLPWLAAGAAAAALLVALPRLWPAPRPADTAPRQAPAKLDPRRVAVLPLQNLSGSLEDDHLVAGLTEQIISTLAQIRGLRVLARTTTGAYRDHPGRIAEIARELASGTVLEGSARRSGERLRISLQLIDGASEEHLWSREFDRRVEDLFVIQSEIALRVAEELRLSISPSRVDRIRRGPTRHIGAYELYLRGREAYRSRTRTGNEEALEYYELALEIDPDFALAEAGKANAYATRGIHYGFGPEAEEAAVRSARRALALNPELPEALKALGIVAIRQDRLREAIELNRRAIELNPSYDEALFNLASALHMSGRWDEALRVQMGDLASESGLQSLAALMLQLGFVEEGARLAERALLETRFPGFLIVNLALLDAASGDFATARERMAALRDARPEWPGAWEISAEIEALSGRPERAAEHFTRAAQAWGGEGYEALINRARAAWLAGDEAAAGRLFAEVEAQVRPFIENGSEFWFHPWAMAAIEATRGRTDEAVRWYERAVELGHRRGWPDELLPVFAGMRDDPRFQAQLERIRMEVAAMREAVRDEIAVAVERLAASWPPLAHGRRAPAASGLRAKPSAVRHDIGGGSP